MVAITRTHLSSTGPSLWDFMNIFFSDRSDYWWLTNPSSRNWDVQDFPDWPAWIVAAAVQHLSPPVSYLG